MKNKENSPDFYGPFAALLRSAGEQPCFKVGFHDAEGGSVHIQNKFVELDGIVTIPQGFHGRFPHFYHFHISCVILQIIGWIVGNGIVDFFYYLGVGDAVKLLQEFSGPLLAPPFVVNVNIQQRIESQSGGLIVG